MVGVGVAVAVVVGVVVGVAVAVVVAVVVGVGVAVGVVVGAMKQRKSHAPAIGELLDLSYMNEELDADNTRLRAAIEDLKSENWQLRQALKLCSTRAGIADPVEACRMVIATVKEALDRGDKEKK